MNVGQAATQLDDQDLLTPEVLGLLKFLETQHEGNHGPHPRTGSTRLIRRE